MEWIHGRPDNKNSLTINTIEEYDKTLTGYSGPQYADGQCTTAIELNNGQDITFTIPKGIYNITIYAFLKDNTENGYTATSGCYFGASDNKSDLSNIIINECFGGYTLGSGKVSGKNYYVTLSVMYEEVSSPTVYHIMRKSDTMGIFWIKIEQQSDDYSIHTLPSVGYQPKLWQAFKTDGMKAYLGGWKYQQTGKSVSTSQLIGKYTRSSPNYYKSEDGKMGVDSWDAAKRVYDIGAEDPYHNERGLTMTQYSEGFMYYSYAQNDAANEYVQPGYGGGYEFTNSALNSADGVGLGNPFTVPTFGDFIKFEPECDGEVTLYVLQNGTIDWDTSKEDKDLHGALTSSIAWRPVYIVDESGRRFSENEVTAQTKTEVAIGKDDETAYVFNSKDTRYVVCKKTDGTYVEEYDLDYGIQTRGGKDYVKIDEVETEVTKATYKELIRNSSHYDDFFSKTFTKGGESIAAWPSTVRTTADGDRVMEEVWGPQYTNDGWLVISKGYVDYTFKVKAGKSYYVFSNNTKLGFCGYTFTKGDSPSGDVILNDGTALNDVQPRIQAKAYSTVTLKRSFHKGWNAICLPFSVTESQMRKNFSSNDMETYELVTYNGVGMDEDENEDGTKENHRKAFFFHHVYQDIIAGYPYMLYIADEDAPAIKNSQAVFTNVTMEPDAKPRWEFTSSGDYTPQDVANLYGIAANKDYTFEGFFSPTEMYKDSYYVVENGLQLYGGATGDKKMKGYRAFLRPTDTSVGANEVARISGTNFNNIIDEMESAWNDATVINDIAEEMGFFSLPSNVYSVSGQLIRANSTSLVGLPKGIYIVNGKKYFVK